MTDESQERRVAHYTESYKALFVLGPFVLKLVSILNSGAAIALLTYSTQVRETISWCGETQSTLGALIPSFVALVLGLVSCATAGIVGYLSQLEVYEASKWTVGTENARKFERSANIKLRWSISLVAASLAVFTIGSIYAVAVLA